MESYKSNVMLAVTLGNTSGKITEWMLTSLIHKPVVDPAMKSEARNIKSLQPPLVAMFL